MLFVFVGRTCSGKTTLRDMMEGMGVEPIVTCTTRPRREQETDGKDYIFLKEDEFERMRAEGKFLETASYDVVGDAGRSTWKYGSLKESYRVAVNSSQYYSIILTPSGIKALIDAGITGFHLIYMSCPDAEIQRRQKERGDVPAEAERRRLADEEVFADFEKYLAVNAHRNLYKYYNLSDLNLSAKELAEMILLACG